jgi:GNAT superfamily N-acetyltransferase
MHTLCTMPDRSCTPRGTPQWTIQPVPPQSIDEVIHFINDARQRMFPGRSLTPDNASLLENGSYFLEARDGKQLIAVIGYVRYNHRFPQFNYQNIRTVEVVRLFVQSPYRRCGLAAAMVEALYDRAVEEGIECFYLHTHPFLEGAIRFWQKRGFEIVQVEDDPIWQTTHMQMMLEETEVKGARETSDYSCG